jgi:hypothetical protein
MTYLNLSRVEIWKSIPTKGESQSAATGARGMLTEAFFPISHALTAKRQLWAGAGQVPGIRVLRPPQQRHAAIGSVRGLDR